MKKFITIALAVAVLFSFAACQEVPLTPQEQLVVSISTESVPTILRGQVPSEEDYVVIGTRWNGETFTVPAEELKFDIVAPSANGENKSAGTVTYIGGYKQGEVKTNLFANVCALVSLEVKGPTSPDYYYEDVLGNTLSDGTTAEANTMFRKDLYTAVLTYTDMEGEEQTVTLASDEYIVDYDDQNVGVATATFRVDLDKDGKTGNTKSDTATVYIMPDDITSWDVRLVDGFEAIVGDAVADDAVANNVVVTATYESKKVVEGETPTSVAVKDAATYGSTWKEGAASISVTFDGTTKDVPVTTKNPYITSFTATYSGSVSRGSAIDKNQIAINPVWAKSVPGTAPSKDSLTLSSTSVPSTYRGNTYYVYATLPGVEEVATISITVVN